MKNAHVFVYRVQTSYASCMSRQQAESATAITKLNESPRGWRSLLVYAAALAYLIELPFVVIFSGSIWDVAVSAILTLFFGIESYVRIARRQTYLGVTFAPVLASFSLGLMAIVYGLSLLA